MTYDHNARDVSHFVAGNILAGMAAFVAPVIAAVSAVAAVSRPDVDVLRVVARMRHPSRLTHSAREAMLEAAEREGLTLEEAIRALSLSDKEMEAVKEIVDRRDAS